MSMLESNNFNSNCFEKRINRFGNSTFVTEEYNSFNFNNNLKSDHIEELEFTNFVSSKNCNKYLDLYNICNSINHNVKNWDKLFIADEIELTENVPKLARLHNIIQAVNNKSINRIESILKFKNLRDNEIQFYIRNENNILTLYLIDLYHIGIEAVNKKTGRVDRKGIYRSRKKHSYDIIEIANSLKLDKATS